MRARSSPLHRAVPRTQVCVPWAGTDAELWKGSPCLCQEGLDKLGIVERDSNPSHRTCTCSPGFAKCFKKSQIPHTAAGKRHSSVQPRMMLRHVALLQPTQAFIFYYTLKWTVFFDAFFFSSGKKLIWVEKYLYDFTYTTTVFQTLICVMQLPHTHCAWNYIACNLIKHH